MNIAAFIFALAGAGLSLFQPVISIPDFGLGMRLGGVSVFDFLMEGTKNRFFPESCVVLFVAALAVISGFSALKREKNKAYVSAVSALGFCASLYFVVILFFLLNSKVEERIFVNTVFSWQKTLLLWASCFTAAAICAYSDRNSGQSSSGSSSTTTLSIFQEAKTFEPVLGVETSALIKRAFIFLADDNFDEAERYFEQALRQNPENSSAYLGKLMAELKAHNMDELSNTAVPLKEQKLFQRALEFANDEEKEQLEFCLKTHEQAQTERKYAEVLEKKEKIDSSFDAQNLLQILDSIAPYKDSEALIQEISQKKQEFEALEKKYSDAVAEKGQEFMVFLKVFLKIAVVVIVITLGALYGYRKFSEYSAAKNAQNEEKARIEALKLELQNKGLLKEGN